MKKMIEFLKIRNFKSIKEAEIRCKKVNIFIGKPNSGKSNILETIGLLSYFAFGGNPEHFFRTTRSRELFYDKDLSKELSLITNLIHLKAFSKDRSIRWLISMESVSSEEIPSSPDEYPPVPKGRIRNYLKIFRFYRFSKPGTKSEPVDYLEPPDGANLLGILNSNHKLRKIVGSFFEEFGYNLILKPDEKKLEILKIIDGIGVSFNIDLISETLLRMVFNFAIIESNKNSVITLEEPESHAFPFYVRLFAEAIARDSSNQFFISTHNPYFLITIAEKVPKADINIFVTDYSNYETKIHIVPEDKLADILSSDIDVFFNLDRLYR